MLVSKPNAPHENVHATIMICCISGKKYRLDQAVEAVKQAMNGVGGQGKVMFEDQLSAPEE